MMMVSKSKIFHCAHCGKGVLIPPNRFETFRYCSRSCAALEQRSHIVASCAVCGGQFQHISSRANRAKYCSRSCYYKAMRLKGSVECACRHCGSQFKASPSEKRKYCSRACINKATKSIWSPSFCTARKSMSRRRLIIECERCGYDREKRILGVHHKDRDRRNNELSNLEVLCPNCHSLEHAKHIAHGFGE